MIGHKALFFLKKGRLEFCYFFANCFQIFPNLQCFAKNFNFTIKTPALDILAKAFLKDQHRKTENKNKPNRRVRVKTRRLYVGTVRPD
jgi:hypothetical protein